MASDAPPRRVYAVGDVHGRRDLLLRLYDLILADLARDPVPAWLVHLGDYVDRGPDSHGVIEALCHAPLPLVALEGNHEQLMRRAGESVSALHGWLLNGGDAALASYGVDPHRGDDPATLMARLRAALPPAHEVLLSSLLPSWRWAGYFFAHAGVRPGVALEAQAREDLLWIRQPFLEDTRDHGAVVVHGHTIRPAPVVRANRIGLDTGAYRSGRLTAAVLEPDTPPRFLYTG